MCVRCVRWCVVCVRRGGINVLELVVENGVLGVILLADLGAYVQLVHVLEVRRVHQGLEHLLGRHVDRDLTCGVVHKW